MSWCEPVESLGLQHHVLLVTNTLFCELMKPVSRNQRSDVTLDGAVGSLV